MPTSVFSPEFEDALSAATTPGEREVQVRGEAVRIATPFPSPQDWRDRWIYFLMVDRFNDPDQPPRALPWDGDHGNFQGGTFRGIQEQLPYLKDLGVGALWLSPVQKNAQWDRNSHHGYGIQDFLGIEPRFASDPEAARTDPTLAEREFRELVDTAHGYGLHVILDIVLNHAGNLFNYEGMQDDAPWNSAREYQVFWRGEDGVPVGAWTAVESVPEPRPAGGVVWPAELQRNDFWRRRGKGGGGVPETMGDFSSLKELVTEYLRDGRSFPVRDILIRAYQYFIARYDIDGFRIDTLKYVEEDFARVFGGACREFALRIGKKNFFTFGEVWENEDEEKIARFVGRNTEKDQEPIGVDAALDFPLYSRLQGVIKGSTPPAELERMFRVRREAHRDLLSSHGEAGRYFVTFLDNHDLDQRFYYQPPNNPNRYDDQLTLALACLFSLQGVPCVYYGTEQGLHGIGNRREFVREALWGKPNAFDRDHPFYKQLQALSALRETEPDLRYGRQYFREVSGNGAQFGHSTFPQGVIAFSRILHSREVLVVANTHPTESQALHVVVDGNLHPGDAVFQVLYSNQAAVTPPGRTSASEQPRSIQVTLAPLQVQILARG